MRRSPVVLSRVLKRTCPITGLEPVKWRHECQIGVLFAQVGFGQLLSRKEHLDLFGSIRDPRCQQFCASFVDQIRVLKVVALSTN